jgi:hypothetical protein
MGPIFCFGAPIRTDVRFFCFRRDSCLWKGARQAEVRAQIRPLWRVEVHQYKTCGGIPRTIPVGGKRPLAYLRRRLSVVGLVALQATAIAGEAPCVSATPAGRADVGPPTRRQGTLFVPWSVLSSRPEQAACGAWLSDKLLSRTRSIDRSNHTLRPSHGDGKADHRDRCGDLEAQRAAVLPPRVGARVWLR